MPDQTSHYPSSKRRLHEMLAEAARNTAGEARRTPPPGYIPPRTAPSPVVAGEAVVPPRSEITSVVVARAIIEACRAVGAKPLLAAAEYVALGVNADGDGATSRARVLAALALSEVYPDEPRKLIGRVVGARQPGSYLGAVQANIRHDYYRWFDRAAYARVLHATLLQKARENGGPHDQGRAKQA